MIEVLGSRRIVFIALLVILNATIASYWMLYAEPQVNQVQIQLSSERSQTTRARNDLADLTEEYSNVQEKLDEYETFIEQGMFSLQERRDSQQTFEDIKEVSNILNARVSLSPGQIETYEVVDKADHAVLMSGIRVEVEAFDDVSLFRYIEMLRKNFPGILTFKDVTIDRVKKLDGLTLREIALGEVPVMVEANLDIEWRTIIPDDKAAAIGEVRR